MFIAIFPSLEGDSVEDVAVRLEERWKVGKKGVDNGVLLVVFLAERKLRIEVGYGLEPVISYAVFCLKKKKTIPLDQLLHIAVLLFPVCLFSSMHFLCIRHRFSE